MIVLMVLLEGFNLSEKSQNSVKEFLCEHFNVELNSYPAEKTTLVNPMSHHHFIFNKISV